MIGVGGVGLVLIIQNIPTIISRNAPTYINTQYIKNWMILERKLNIKPYMLMFLATSSVSESSIPKYALVAVMFA